MRTLNELKLIEKYLLNKMSISSKLVFEAKLLIDPVLKRNVEWQRKLYSIVRLSGRRIVQAEAERIHHKLFSDPAKQAFHQSIFQLFPKK